MSTERNKKEYSEKMKKYCGKNSEETEKIMKLLKIKNFNNYLTYYEVHSWKNLIL